MIRKTMVVIAGLTFFAIACTKKKEDIITTSSSTTSTNDSCSTNISYNKHIKPIVTKYCISCHSITGGQKDFTGYAGVKDGASTGHMKERINGTDVVNYNLMPPAKSLTACELAKMNAWLNAGAPNN